MTDNTRMAIAAIDHVEVDDSGVARIAGTRMRVIYLVMERDANHWSIEQVHEGHDHLSLAQILAAFAYYYDHKSELDLQIQQSIETAENLRKEAGESPVARRLREQGLLP